MLEKAKNYRSILIEEAVQADEALMEKFFNEGEEAITEDELARSSQARNRWPILPRYWW